MRREAYGLGGARRAHARARTPTLVLGLGTAAIAVACGGGAGLKPNAPATSPAEGAVSDKAPTSAEPQTVAEAREQIARAKAELEWGDRARAEGRAEDAKASGASEAPTGGAPAPEERQRSETPGCRTPCQALRSMRRAVDALCRMTGSGDERCTEAQRTLQSSEQRVATCGC